MVSFPINKKTVFLAAFLATAVLHAGMIWKKSSSPDELSYELKRDNGYYILEASLPIASGPGCLLEVIYSPYHMRKLMRKDADALEILKETPASYELRSVHKNKICLLDTVYRRELLKEKMRVGFELVKCEQKGKVAPQLVSSEGYYEVRPETGGSRLYYYEKTKLETGRWDPRALALVKVVERDTLMFLKKLKKYSEQTACRTPS
ncbi:MAG: hypothetical protein BWY42_00017 [Candidatus Omnitrophica bacterium ADurb.Bin277]|nr:MAG: hypothetical protein BWY42_00017 [Candidatus Omnitrophica bacterium ADurb.Bin277]